jgi:hypothetical protein
LRVGMPGDSGGPVVATLVCVTTLCARGCGCSGHPAFPTPSVGRKIHAQLGRIAPRDRKVASPILQLSSPAKAGDPVFRDASDGIEKPRRTGYPAGACHRARRRETRWRGMTTSCGAALSFSSGAHSRDPLANPSTAGIPPQDINAASGSDCGNAVGFRPTGYKNRAYQGEIT